MLHPSSGSKSKPSKKPTACCLLHAGFLLGILLNLEDRGNMFLSGVG
jgi:hypothetical protein